LGVQTQQCAQVLVRLKERFDVAVLFELGLARQQGTQIQQFLAALMRIKGDRQEIFHFCASCDDESLFQNRPFF
jgi:hypothetical protein